MKPIILATALVLASGGAQDRTIEATAGHELRLARSLICFKTGEESPPGSMTKICYYDCLGSRVAITINSISLCPLTIQH